MATAISKNQYDYLNGLVSKGGGNGEWAKLQLADSTYAPPAPAAAPSVPTNMNVPPSPTQAASAGKVPTSNIPAPPAPPKTPAATTTNPNVQQYADFQKNQADLMDQIKSYMQPMNYDPNTDPSYLAYKQLAAAGAKDASLASMEDLNSRGILNSSVTRDDVADIEQKYAAQAAAQIPVLQQQAYQRQRDRVGDIFNLLTNSQNQQQRAIDNANVDRNYTAGRQDAATAATGYYTPDSGTLEGVQRQMAANSAAYASASPEEQRRLHEENVRLAATIGGKDSTGNGDYVYSPIRTVQGQQLDYNQQKDQRDFEYQTLQDAIKNGMTQQQIDNQAQQFADRLGFDYKNMNADDKRAWAQIAISQQSANTSAYSASASAGNAAARLAWDKDPKNPDNIYKLSQSNKPKTTDYKTDPNFASDVAHLKSSPNDVAKLDSNPQPFIDAYGYDGYLALRKAAGIDD